MGLLSFTGVYVFGDSLIDSGNALKAAETYDDFPFNSLPDGAPTEKKGYYSGNFTDGWTFADLLSDKFLSKYTKSTFPFGFISYPFQGDPDGNNLNFAYGGAQIRQGDELVLDMDDQTDAFRDAVDGDADSNALYLFSFGANDVHDLVPKEGAWADLATAQAVLASAADEWIEEIRQTIEIGARHVLALGIPDIGVQPYYNGLIDEADRRAVGTQYSKMLDDMIQARLGELEALSADFQYLSFTGMQSAILDNLAKIYPLSALYPLNTSKTVFFDKAHPTAQLHALATAYLLDQLSGTSAGDEARLIAPDLSLGGSIAAAGEVDKLVFALAANTAYTFEMLGLSSGPLTAKSWETLADPLIRIVGPAGAVLYSNDDGGLGLDARVQFTTATAGNYTVELDGVGSFTGQYLLQAENQSAQNNAYTVTSSATLVVEGPEDGTDRIYAAVSYALSEGSYIETLSTNRDKGTAAINLTGNALGQTLIGNNGANFLDGKGGNDSLWGKGGADLFAFTTPLGPGNVDTINDYSAAADTILLDDAVFAGLPLGTLAAGAYRRGAVALDADDRILFDPLSHALSFDQDGAGGIAPVQFAILLGNNMALGAADFVVV